MRQVVFIDVETGGLDPHGDALLEVGAVLPSGEQWSCFVRPEGKRIHPAALEINGIDVEGEAFESAAMDRRVAAQFFDGWLQRNAVREGWILAGMNAAFDRAFVMQWWRDTKGIFPKPGHRVLDLHSVAVADWYMREGLDNEVPPLYSDAISEMLGMRPEARPHRALAGAMWCREAMGRLVCADFAQGGGSDV
jgi:DNA polymerase III epsilon subunit-like protein